MKAPAACDLTLSMAAIGLATLLVLDWAGGDAATAAMPASAAAVAAQVGSLGPLAAYADVVERPLFAPSRRPPAAPVAAPVPPVPVAASRPPPAIELVGVAMSGDRHYALVRTPGGRSTRVAEGESVEGWQVTHIEADRIRLNRGGDAVDISLVRPGPPVFPAALDPRRGADKSLQRN